MRHRWVVAALVLCVSVSAVPAGAAEGDFIVDGGGWGHGVGMSQYGAYGMALEGRTAEEIIGHYYSGAQITSASDLDLPEWIFEPQALAVNVASKRTELDFEVFAGEIEACQAGEPEVCRTLVQGEFLRVTWEDDATCTTAVVVNGAPEEGSENNGPCLVDVSWDDSFASIFSVENLVRIPDSFDNPDLIYARGPFQLRPNANGSSFDVTVRLGLEEYLLGIGEVPLSWPQATLEAQAISARSYAVRIVATNGGDDGSGRRQDCGCHIRRTPADQNYDAWLVEKNDIHGRWAAAISGTGSQVVTHPAVGNGGQVVTTYYSSSTGGWTENLEDVFGGDPQPHLRSVEDPWSVDPKVNNPFATWTTTVVKSAAASYLGWDEVRRVTLVAGPPGSKVRFEGVDDGVPVTAERTGWQVRNALGLRSPYISAVTREGPPPPPFTDIDASIHYDDIAYIWRAGVTRGCNPPDNDLYCPGQAVTRQQMASFIVRALDLPGSEGDAFGDDDGSIHENDINALAAAGITKGCNPPNNDRFCPEQPVTRAQMAAFLVRAYGYTDSGEGDLFVDDNGSIFEGDIDRLAVAGVTKGCNPPDNDRFCPEDAVTRAQMASFLARAMPG